jgi:RNA polymerase sigma-70 factor (ECF subfamily)
VIVRSVARLLADRTGRDLDGGALDEIAAALDAAAAETRARWPAITQRDEIWVDVLASRVHVEPDLGAALALLALPDLYLVGACLAGDHAALAVFEALARAETARAVARLGSGAPVVDDVVQELLLKLLVGPPPKLVGFAGHGALQSWLRIAGVRTAISLGRRRQEQPIDDDALAAIADDTDDQALAFLKSSYREAFTRSFAAALAELPKRSRTLLRMQVNDQLTIEEIGAFYGVSRATSARWLAEARADLVGRTRAALASSLGVPTEELTQLMHLVASNLYSTLPRLLRVTSS